MRFTPGAEHERQRAVAPVLGTHEELRTAVLMDVVQPSLLDDADDRQRTIAERIFAPSGLPVGKNCLARRPSINASRTSSRRASVEGAAGKQPHAHDLDVAARRADVIDERRVPIGIAGVPGRARDSDRLLTRGGRERQRRRGAHARDAGYRRKRVFDPVLEGEDVGDFREELGRHRHAHGEDAVRL